LGAKPRIRNSKSARKRSCQLLIGDAAANDLLQNFGKSLRIVPLSLIVPKRLFIQVPNQMERLNTNVGSPDGSFQEAPEVLKPVGMNSAPDILNGMARHSFVDCTPRLS
jgi:hypothetical protein